MTVSAEDDPPAAAGGPGRRLATAVLVILFAAMFGCVALQVVLRYVAILPAPWTEELARFLLVVMVHLGAVVVWLRGDHIRSDFLLARAGPRLRRAIETATLVLAVLLLLAVAGGCRDMAALNWQRQSSSMPWLRLGHLYAVEGLCALAMALLAARDAWRMAAGGVRRGPGGAGC